MGASGTAVNAVVFIAVFVVLAESAGRDRQWWMLESGQGLTASGDEPRNVNVTNGKGLLIITWKGKQGVWTMRLLEYEDQVQQTASYIRNDSLKYSIRTTTQNGSLEWYTEPTYNCTGPVVCQRPGEWNFTVRCHLGNWSYVERPDGKWGVTLETETIVSITLLGEGNNGPGIGNWTSEQGIQTRDEEPGLDNTWTLVNGRGWVVEKPSNEISNVSVVTWKNGVRNTYWLWWGENGRWEVSLLNFPIHSKLRVTYLLVSYFSENILRMEVKCGKSRTCGKHFKSSSCSPLNETSWMLHTRLGSFGIKSISKNSHTKTMDLLEWGLAAALPVDGEEENFVGESFNRTGYEVLHCKQTNDMF